VEAQIGADHEPRYYPIGAYGAIGDCRTAALVAPNGSIDWLCFPHFDSPAIFLRLLDADKGGYFRISPTDQAQASMTYLPETNVLETTFSSEHGRMRLLDFMPIRKRQKSLHALQRVPALLQGIPHGLDAGLEREIGNDVAAAHRVTRMATCLEGSVPVELVLKVTFDYARRQPTITWHNLNDDAVGAILTDGERYLVFTARYLHPSTRGEPPIALEDNNSVLRVRATLHAGGGIIAQLNYARSQAEADDLLRQLAAQPFQHDLDETLTYWRTWGAACHYTGTYQFAVLRSALALKLCTFEPTGAIVAAPTTSLPEAIGSVRNWDYRYTWLRDSAFTLGALGRLGYTGEARDYFHFLHDLQIKSGDDIRIMYGIRGETNHALDEQELAHLEGYRGSRPVRLGNGAAHQRQLDVYGELLDAAYTYATHAHMRLDSLPQRDMRTLSATVADYVSAHWRDLDRGIWEVRGDPRAFVYSRVMCWVALDRACRMAPRHGHHAALARWHASRVAIAADVLAHGYNEQFNTFVQSYDSTVLDAANLRIPLVGFLHWEDARTAGTVAATMRVLSGADALVYRYRTISDGAGDGENSAPSAAADDGLPGTEGSFLACAFWMVENLCYLGRIEEARERFEMLLSHASPLGLFSEELDPATGEQLGNYPQAFTHIGLINCAVTLQRAQEGILRAQPPS
jgi:GH15 family glucan-1,4-alpha-glucosidase